MHREPPDPQEEFRHEPLSEDPLWRESYCFDFYDPETDLAYFSSVGHCMNKGGSGVGRSPRIGRRNVRPQ
jgi:hypothetical protein